MSLRLVGLIGVVMLSALSVVAIRHQNRLAFVNLQEQAEVRERLQIEWGRLMIEKTTWTRQHDLSEAARKRLAMVVPQPQDIITLPLRPR